MIRTQLGIIAEKSRIRIFIGLSMNGIVPNDVIQRKCQVTVKIT